MPTGIEYLDEVWNPVTGCTPVSPACDHCWARAMTKRLQGMGMEKYAKGFDTVVCHESEITYPRKLKKPKVIGVCFMADLFNIEVSDHFILRCFKMMEEKAKQHIYVLLTKRAHWLPLLRDVATWTENIWAGVTVENEYCADRIYELRECEAKYKWISFEPLLESVGELNLTGINWAVIGCESGPGARPMKEEWVREIDEQCKAAGVPVFYKQAMVDDKLVSMPLLDGVRYDYNAPAEMLKARE